MTATELPLPADLARLTRPLIMAAVTDRLVARRQRRKLAGDGRAGACARGNARRASGPTVTGASVAVAVAVAAVRDDAVRPIAQRAAGLSPAALDAVLRLVEVARADERLPEH